MLTTTVFGLVILIMRRLHIGLKPQNYMLYNGTTALYQPVAKLQKPVATKRHLTRKAEKGKSEGDGHGQRKVLSL